MKRQNFNGCLKAIFMLALLVATVYGYSLLFLLESHPDWHNNELIRIAAWVCIVLAVIEFGFMVRYAFMDDTGATHSDRKDR